jgi:hypothetical protein
MQEHFSLETDVISLVDCIIDVREKGDLNNDIRTPYFLNKETGEKTQLSGWTGLKRGSKKAKKRNSTAEDALFTCDVFSIFDALTYFAKEPYMSILALVDLRIGEDDGEGWYSEVLGRACGDRVAVVTIKDMDLHSNLQCKEIISTCVHECSHTIGFDHCNSFQCVMNARGEDFWILLSPCNLRKLKAFHKIKDGDFTFVLERDKRLLKILTEIEDREKLGGEGVYLPEIKWLKSKIEALECLTTCS